MSRLFTPGDKKELPLLMLSDYFDTPSVSAPGRAQEALDTFHDACYVVPFAGSCCSGFSMDARGWVPVQIRPPYRASVPRRGK